MSMSHPEEALGQNQNTLERDYISQLAGERDPDLCEQQKKNGWITLSVNIKLTFYEFIT